MFGRNSKVNLELNREVEKLIKTGGKEQLLPIVQAGEPVLRQQTAAYEGQLSRKTLDKLIETMRVTMIEAPGVGLAATQIGLGLALAVVEDHVRDDDDDDPREAAEFPFHVIINPSYEPIGTETRSFYEGCLSFDGYQAVRKRWLDITARWQEDDANRIHARRKTLRNPIVTESYRCAIRGISCRGRGPQASPFLSYRHFFVIHHAHNPCNARTHHIPRGRRTYERNHVCISRHYRQYRRSRCDGMISYATSCSVCNEHDRILTTNAW